MTDFQELILDACHEGDVVEVQRLLPQAGDPADVTDWKKTTFLHNSCHRGWLDVTKGLVEQYHCDPESTDRWDGDTPLHVACREGHVDIVRYLVSEQGCNTACQNIYGDAPLHVACCKGHVDIVRYLVSEQGCSTACQNKNGDTPLLMACRGGHLTMVKALTRGQDCEAAFNCQNKDGHTPLHVACFKGHVNVVRYLVSEWVCSTACQNKNGDTLLHEACREGHRAMVKALTSGQDCKAACNCQNKDGDTPLHVACYWGHVDIVRYLVSEQGCSMACQNKNGDTPMYVAYRMGRVDIVRYLVSEQGCSAACQNKNGDTPLHVACREGHLTMVKALTSGQDCKVACNCQNKDGDTPLHVACYWGHVDIVRYLVSEQGCSAACQNKNGDIPLHVACREGHLTMVKVLTRWQDCKAACNCQNKGGDTPLHVACLEGHVDIVRYLVSEQGCSTACQNKNGDTLLHVACGEGHLALTEIFLTGQNCSAVFKSKNKCGKTVLHYSCHHGWLDVTRRLIEQYHCDPESGDNDSDVSLHVACRKGNVDIVNFLVSEQGCNIACQNDNGDTPLHVAFRAGHLAVTEILLTGQNCNAGCISKNKYGKTVLHYSCQNGWLDMTRRLVEQYHCDPESRDNDSDTPLHVACCEGHVNIVKYLVSEQGCSTACLNKSGDTLLYVACREGHLAMVKALTSGQDYKAACNSQNKWGDTPLLVAHRQGHVETVRYLIAEQGCSTCISYQNKIGDTPLHVTCREGHLAMVKALTSGQDCKAACNCQNKDGDTPLLVACRKGHVDIVRYLVSEQGCSTACQNKEGDSPLHVACCKGHVDIVRCLVSEQECSTACQNKDGVTPLHMACRWNRANVVQFLLSTGRADPWCKNTSGHTPVQLTDNYEISKMFIRFTTDLVTAIKVFIFGNPAAGKSTLVKVIEKKVTSRFGAIAGQFRNVSGVELKTAGINAVTIQNSRLGSVTVYDLAGQFEYYSSHDALLGNLMSSSAAIFIAVVKLNDSEPEVIQTLQYWISFIENCCSRVETTAHLMVVGSWADKVKEAIDQKWLNIKKACISSSSPLHFEGFTALDCRRLASSGLDKICDMIGSSCTALREAAEQKRIIYPHLLHAFISTKLSSKVACSVRELCTLITREDDALLPTEQNLLSPLLSSLSDGGHLLYLPNKEDFKAGWVVINKQAVLSEINGTIFAPEYFRQHHDIATSTGVVPKSKIAGVFAEKYNIDVILSVLTLFEFCQKIKDSFTLSLIASSDPSGNGDAAMTTSDESSENYYFFPALVQVEHPTDVWQSSGSGQYQCGWCLKCSKDGQYLTPRFLHVLLLRLAFYFALEPDNSQQDEASSPVLRRRCAIWKNGIQWLDQDGVETIVEVSQQNKLVLLLMVCPEGEEMACVQLCPGISTTELLIDPSNLSNYPLPSSSELTLYTMADQVVKAVREHKQFAVDRTGRRKMKLVDALHFEPYLGMQVRLIDQLFDKHLANQEVGDDFLHDLAADIYSKLIQQLPIEMVLRMFNISDDSLFYSYFEQFPSERDNPVMRCFRLLLTWKNCDTGGSTYQSLHTTLDKYSIFCGRNPVSNQLKQLENTSLMPIPHSLFHKEKQLGQIILRLIRLYVCAFVTSVNIQMFCAACTCSRNGYPSAERQHFTTV